MTPRPTRIVQTSTEVKKLHKRNNGPALPERQQRQLARDAELEDRALRLREQDKRRKAATKKREEREKREKEVRKQAGVGLATQLIGYSHTQAKLKSGMEAFLGIKNRRDEERRKDEEKTKELEVAKQLEALMEDEAKEPWDEDEAAFDMPELITAGGEQWIDDDLDDDTLLGVHDLIMSDPVEDPTDIQQPPAPISIPEVPKCSPSKESSDFVRLHGPINKVFESILDNLPEPLIELLSQDSSTKPIIWDPAPSLLHKLNPPGLPPHRLRIKVGCVVTLLRDLNSSSQLSKSQHLRILRREKERLECLVLDGQLEGTKTVLTRVSFSARHRHDAACEYERMQFPIQVAKNWVLTGAGKETLGSSSTFKLPSRLGQAPQPTRVPKKLPAPNIPTPQPTTTTNPNFKLPGLPASKAKHPTPSEPPDPPSCFLLDGWDAFLDSGTQIARELSSKPSSPIANTSPALIAHSLPSLSAQDFDFELDDLDDEFHVKSPPTEADKSIPTSMPPPKTPKLHSYTRPKPPRKSPFPRTDHPVTSKHKTSHPPPPPQPASKRKTMDAAIASGPPQPKRLASHQPSGLAVPYVPAKPTIVAPRVGLKSLESFSEFGLSTQEAVSFFDDDEDVGFGSPSIAV